MSTAILGLRPSTEKPLLPSQDSRPVPIRNEAGRVVGSVRVVSGRRTFLKTVDPDRHQLRHPRAWANDKTTLDQALAAGADFVCHKERLSRRRWWAPLAAFAEHGFPVTRGHGEQVGLALGHWHLDDSEERQQVQLFRLAGTS